MKYHAETNRFTVAADDLQSASQAMRWAIRKIRLASGLSTKGYRRPGQMDDAELAESAVLDAASCLGIDLGAYTAGRLDVSDE